MRSIIRSTRRFSSAGSMNAATSMRQKKWPTFCGRSMCLYIDPTSLPTAAPESTPENSSTIIGQGGALVAGHGQHGAGQGRGGVGRGVAVGVQGPAFRDRPARLVGGDDVAAGDQRRGQIDLAAESPCRWETTTAIGLVPKKASHPPAGDIAGSQLVMAMSTMSCARRPVAVVRQGPEMLRAADRGRGDAVLPGQRHQQVERLDRLHLAQPVGGVDRPAPPGVASRSKLGRRIDQSRWMRRT